MKMRSGSTKVSRKLMNGDMVCSTTRAKVAPESCRRSVRVGSSMAPVV